MTMSLFGILSILMVLSAIFGYLNVRFIKLPITIGMMLISILFSLLVLIVGQVNPAILQLEQALISEIDFERVLMEGMLSFLLFAGALHVDFEQLKQQRSLRQWEQKELFTSKVRRVSFVWK